MVGYATSVVIGPGFAVPVHLPSFPARHRQTRTLGQREARARQAGTARPANAHAASLAHVPLLPRAVCGRRAMAHARAAAAAAPAIGDSRRPRRSSRLFSAVRSPSKTRGSRREFPRSTSVRVRAQGTHTQVARKRTLPSPIEGCRDWQMDVSGHSGRGRAPPGVAATSEEGVARWSNGSPSGVSAEWGHKKWPKAHWGNDGHRHGGSDCRV